MVKRGANVLGLGVVIVLLAMVVLHSFLRERPSCTTSAMSWAPRSGQPVVTFRRLGEYGRLGNQIFQVVATLAVAKAHSATPELPARALELPLAQLFELSGIGISRGPPHEINASDHVLTAGAAEFLLPARLEGRTIDLQGYFQHKDYALYAERQLAQALQLRQGVTDRALSLIRPDTIAIHVRRGDYLQLSHLYEQPTTTYFQRALEGLAAGLDEVDVVIVSDDIEWCRANLTLRALTDRQKLTVRYSPFKSEVDDFLLLYLAPRIIISNSSFSWWAAWLKRLWQRQRHVVMPWPWYVVNSELSIWNDLNAYKGEQQWMVLHASTGLPVQVSR